MGKSRRLHWAALAASIAMVAAASAQAAPRAVIELFTSQGCSSCPPADRLLGELSGDASLITLSLPVDYWDYLGWKDTLGDPRNSARQRAYARVRGDGEVYTPQVVVNGAAGVVGSDKSALEDAMAQTRRDPATLSVPVTLAAAGDTLTVDVGGNKDAVAAEVWIYGIARAVPVAVARGENRGHTIVYHNVARRWLKLGDWRGTPAHWNVSLKDLAGAGVNAAAVFVQSGTAERPGKMLGAALANLP